jgi:acyl-homoserine-lactone acylase
MCPVPRSLTACLRPLWFLAWLLSAPLAAAPLQSSGTVPAPNSAGTQGGSAVPMPAGATSIAGRAAPTPLSAASTTGGAPDPNGTQQTSSAAADSQQPPPWAAQVVIYRDGYGVPHIDGATDAAVAFGAAYAQAEDGFWQIEDSYLLGLGRYSEVHGVAGLNSDLLNRAFEIVPRSRDDFSRLDPEIQHIYTAYVAGLNFFLDTHPEVQPRRLTRFEPWHVLAFGRHLFLETAFRYTRLPLGSYLPRSHGIIWSGQGSNAWAIGPQRTRSGAAMLLVNPHQPWFGFGQLYEIHLRSGQGWNLTGATIFGSPMPSVGHNGYLGWALTTNEPDIADVWRETFDHPHDPLQYRYGDGYRRAQQWSDTIYVRRGERLQPQVHTFRKTHRGPIVAQHDATHYLSVRISGLWECLMVQQSLRMVKARNWQQFRQAVAGLDFPLMNIVYADREGNIALLYNGRVPRRTPGYDYSQPLDGSDPRTDWQGYHTLDELPVVFNPPSHYVQNCNSTPFTTCDDGNPRPQDFPPYMLEDAGDDRQRARMSRRLLRQMHEVTFEDVQRAAFDTTMHWAVENFPTLAAQFDRLADTHPEVHRAAKPYWEHLQAWDGRCTLSSTQATLCEAWHCELYGGGYPGESLKPEYRDAPQAMFRALVRAAGGLHLRYGTWRVAWGDIHRLQRHAYVADLMAIPFDDARPSFPSPGVPGPLGAVFTQYYLPPLGLPGVHSPRKHYAVVGTSYVGLYEFAPRVRGGSLVAFGQSGDPQSPHFADQVPLHVEGKLKPALFYWDDVLRAARHVYRPGEPPREVDHTVASP